MHVISGEEQGCHTKIPAIFEVYFAHLGNTVKNSVLTKVGAQLNPDQYTFKVQGQRIKLKYKQRFCPFGA